MLIQHHVMQTHVLKEMTLRHAANLVVIALHHPAGSAVVVVGKTLTLTPVLTPVLTPRLRHAHQVTRLQFPGTVNVRVVPVPTSMRLESTAGRTTPANRESNQRVPATLVIQAAVAALATPPPHLLQNVPHVFNLLRENN